MGTLRALLHIYEKVCVMLTVITLFCTNSLLRFCFKSQTYNDSATAL
jgi:hypothetical protein